MRWWAEVAGGERDAEGRGHPVGAALLDTVERHGLPREPLADMADAAANELYADPPETVEDFEAEAGRLSSVPIQLAALMLDPEAAPKAAEASGHAGVYQRVVDVLASAARDRARGRVRLPNEMLLRAGLVTPDDLRQPDFAEAAVASRVIDAGLTFAREHRERFDRAAFDLPRSLAPAFATANARRATEREIARLGAEVLKRDVAPSALALQRAVTRTPKLFAPEPSLFGRFRERWLGRPG